MEILLPSEEVTEVEFQYLKIEKHCFTCFSLLHEEEDCPSRQEELELLRMTLGITRAIALQRIEADKRDTMINEAIGDLLLNNLAQIFLPRRIGGASPLLDNRDSHLLEASMMKLLEPLQHQPPEDRSGGDQEDRSRGSRGSIADGQIIYPVNQNNSGGQSNSRERIPTRDRLSGQSGIQNTSMVPVIELQDNGGEVAVEPALQPSHLASGSRVPASLRLGSPSVSGNRNKAKVTAAATLSKHAGKRKKPNASTKPLKKHCSTIQESPP
ncbi:hypothetical protein Bca52824_005566 [Brassica carinata]|uniref:Zinc knuckle CX2CX4HX4C domain-containing protein n=1 Tax=Brassica carinata TaxID=52824 RepID=A0A8X7WRJ6_BRACI|nr:hypothetical protein Bca52824_005566 [Brassica carinata]